MEYANKSKPVFQNFNRKLLLSPVEHIVEVVNFVITANGKNLIPGLITQLFLVIMTWLEGKRVDKIWFIWSSEASIALIDS
jgi:hypothetical protein